MFPLSTYILSNIHNVLGFRCSVFKLVKSRVQVFTVCIYNFTVFMSRDIEGSGNKSEVFNLDGHTFTVYG